MSAQIFTDCSAPAPPSRLSVISARLAAPRHPGMNPAAVRLKIELSPLLRNNADGRASSGNTQMYRSEASRDLPIAASGDARHAVSTGLASPLPNVAADRLSRTARRLAATRAALLIIGIAVQVFVLLGAPDEARADCASGDGNIAAPGTCTVPQVLTGSAAP